MSFDLEFFQKDLKEDIKLDRANPQAAAVENPVIYSKWVCFSSDLKKQRIKLEADRIVAIRDSLMHMTGRGDDVCMYEFSSTELRQVIPAEDKVLTATKKVEYLDVLIKFCDGAIESIRQRGFSIRAIIDHQALLAGTK